MEDIALMSFLYGLIVGIVIVGIIVLVIYSHSKPYQKRTVYYNMSKEEAKEISKHFNEAFGHMNRSFDTMKKVFTRFKH